MQKARLGNTDPIFVIQEHSAKKLHYDLRLQIGHILVSWTVPKELINDSEVEHVAVQTEDHPLNYADFEGKANSDQGVGEVSILDKGLYHNSRLQSISRSLKLGHIEVEFIGSKLQGNYVLLRAEGTRDTWSLYKMKCSTD